MCFQQDLTTVAAGNGIYDTHHGPSGRAYRTHKTLFITKQSFPRRVLLNRTGCVWLSLFFYIQEI